MTEPTNAHDMALREALSRLQVAAEFVANYLPGNVTELIDLSSIEQVPDSFVAPELREHYSDLVYRVKLKSGGDAFIFVLIEHKSHPDEIFGVLEHFPAPELDKVESIRAVLIYWAKARGIKKEDVRRVLEMQETAGVENAMTAIDEWIQEGYDKGVVQGRQQGIEQGIERGRQEGLALAALHLLRTRLGALDTKMENEIRELPYGQLDDLIGTALEFDSVADLAAWMREHGASLA